MYQIEVKLITIEHLFNPAAGWKVVVDIDPMEMGKGSQHPPGKADVAKMCRTRLESMGVHIGADEEFGRADVVARHPEHSTYVIEVEGDTRRQKEQAMYSALGQTLLTMTGSSPNIRYALAVPDDAKWRYQIAKIPLHVLVVLQLDVLLVSHAVVQRIPGTAR